MDTTAILMQIPTAEQTKSIWDEIIKISPILAALLVVLGLIIRYLYKKLQDQEKASKEDLKEKEAEVKELYKTLIAFTEVETKTNIEMQHVLEKFTESSQEQLEIRKQFQQKLIENDRYIAEILLLVKSINDKIKTNG